MWDSYRRDTIRNSPSSFPWTSSNQIQIGCPYRLETFTCSCLPSLPRGTRTVKRCTFQWVTSIFSWLVSAFWKASWQWTWWRVINFSDRICRRWTNPISVVLDRWPNPWNKRANPPWFPPAVTLSAPSISTYFGTICIVIFHIDSLQHWVRSTCGSVETSSGGMDQTENDSQSPYYLH